MENKRLILIGLDGATWDLLDKWIRHGELPNWKKLRSEGSYGMLESTIPHVTPPAWTSITTGKNPGKHGIFDFTGVEKSDNEWNFNLYTSKSKKPEEIWDYLVDKKSIIVNVPLTYPPRKIDGIMITGMYTPSKNSEFVYPGELKKTVLKQFPNYEVELRWSEYEGKKNKFLNDLYRMTEERIKLFWHFYRLEWDFFFFVFVGTDRIQHILWEEDELLEYYKYLDEFLGEVIKHVSDNNIDLFLVSDHGFTKIKKIIHINSFLYQQGYLKPNANLSDKSLLKKVGLTKEKLNVILLKYKLVNLYNTLPSKVLHVIRKTVPGYSNPIYDFDLENSEAVMAGTGSIYIIKDRTSVKEEIIRKLENLKDPDTGENVIEKVFRKEEIYSGPLLEKAPDLLVLPKKGYSLVSSGLDKIFEKPTFKKADHALDGIFLAYGPEIKAGVKIHNAKVYDIAPTILHMFGLWIPDDIDGRVLKEIFKEDSEPAKREIKYQRMSKEKEKIREKIEKLKNTYKI